MAQQEAESTRDGSESSSHGEGTQSPEHNSESAKLRGAQKWDDYFMAVAFLTKLRSKDPRTQVGACIVNKDKQIVAIGYNGLPVGCSNDDFPWGREGEEKKYPYVCHAEMNAIVNRTSTNLKGCTVYTTLSPCAECTKLIIRSGIKEVVWAERFREAPSTEELVEWTKAHTQFTYRQYKSEMKTIQINLKTLGESPSPQELPLSSTEERPAEERPAEACPAEERPAEERPAAAEKRPAELIIKWEDYHMALASLLSWPFHDEDSDGTVADCERTGACIVNEERRIVGTGSSSASLPNPYGIDPWAVPVPVQRPVTRGHKNVMNAILNRTAPSLKGCTVYTTVFPCNECAKLIIQSGVQKVVFAEKLKEDKDAEKLLYHAGVCHNLYNAWPSTYKKKTKIEMDLRKAETSDDACCMRD